MTTINREAQAVIDRLARVRWETPTLDKKAIAFAFEQHLQALGLKARPVIFIETGLAAGITRIFERAAKAARENPAAAWDAARDAAWAAARAAAWAAARAAAWAAAWAAARDAAWDAARAAARDAARAAARDAARAAAWDAAWDAARAAARDAARAAAWAAAWDAARAAARAAAWDAARDAAWDAAWAAAWDAAWAAALLNSFKTEERPAAVARWLAASEPLLAALEAGLGFYWVTEDAVYVVPRPALHVDARNRPHREDGAATEWLAPNGEKYYFWHGVRVPEHVVIAPTRITYEEIRKESNAEVRRVMIERYGAARYIEAAGANLQHKDEFGELYLAKRAGDSDLVMVKVLNSTIEDGHRKTYWLRVHPELRPMRTNNDGSMWLGEPQPFTARNAVASTFGLRGEQYAPRAEA